MFFFSFNFSKSVGHGFKFGRFGSYFLTHVGSSSLFSQRILSFICLPTSVSNFHLNQKPSLDLHGKLSTLLSLGTKLNRLSFFNPSGSGYSVASLIFTCPQPWRFHAGSLAICDQNQREQWGKDKEFRTLLLTLGLAAAINWDGFSILAANCNRKDLLTSYLSPVHPNSPMSSLNIAVTFFLPEKNLGGFATGLLPFPLWMLLLVLLLCLYSFITPTDPSWENQVGPIQSFRVST